MSDTATAQAGGLETPDDAGEGPAGVVSRWMMELDLASKDEKFWRDRAADVNARYRDEKNESQSNTSTIGRYQSGDRFNILYSNIQTICPALYNQTPRPDVRRRYRDADETGRVIADVMERALSFTLDDEDFDRFMKMAVKDVQLTGRAVTRVKYQASFSEGDDGEVEGEEVGFEHVNWADFRRGPGRTWEEVMWVGFRHTFDKNEVDENFPDTAKDIPLDYSPEGLNGKNDDDDPINDTFKRAVVWEIWDKKKREVVFICPGLAERPCKTVDDPLTLKDFWPIPRPLYAVDYTDSLIPVEPFRYYEDQANELDLLTRRISGVVEACKVRGIYDTTISEMSNIMDSRENMLVPATDILPLMQAGGLDKAIWLWPIEKIASVLVHLYRQREAVKTTIYEITGIADIMRGSSAASETLGAQQLKAQFGTMRLDDMRREVQRYARDLVRLSAEIIAEQFSPETMQIMTEVKLPTAEEKQMAQVFAQQAQQAQQPIPDEVKKALEDPTWAECLQILRDDQQRAYRIDIETDSTIAGDQAQEQRNITDLLTGISLFIQNAGPAVAAGYLPLEAAKALLMTSVRKFKMGREVEDALDMIGEDEGGEDQQDPQVMQMQQQMQEMQPILQQLQQENEQLKADRGAEEQRTMIDAEKAKADYTLKQGDQALKEQEFQLKAAQPIVTPQEQWQYDMQMAREKMEFEAEQKVLERQASAEQKALDREADIAKAIIAKSEEDSEIDDVLADLHANKTLTYNEDGSISGYETTDIEATIARMRDVIAQQSSADRGGLDQALVSIAEMQAQTGQLIVESNDRLVNAITAPKRAIYEDGRPVGIETV
jgi:hypothetical protein